MKSTFFIFLQVSVWFCWCKGTIIDLYQCLNIVISGVHIVIFAVFFDDSQKFRIFATVIAAN